MGDLVQYDKPKDLRLAPRSYFHSSISEEIEEFKEKKKKIMEATNDMLVAGMQ